jgi:hypothetical protein
MESESKAPVHIHALRDLPVRLSCLYTGVCVYRDFEPFHTTNTSYSSTGTFETPCVTKHQFEWKDFTAEARCICPTQRKELQSVSIPEARVKNLMDLHSHEKAKDSQVQALLLFCHSIESCRKIIYVQWSINTKWRVHIQKWKNTVNPENRYLVSSPTFCRLHMKNSDKWQQESCSSHATLTFGNV